MTLDELTAIEERLNAATPGPWFSYHAEKGWTVQVPNGWLMQASDKCGPHDATFIAHAPTDLRTLIDALRAEREENERLESDLAKLRAERDELRTVITYRVGELAKQKADGTISEAGLGRYFELNNFLEMLAGES